MKRDDVFEVLTPPPHGLTRLRARMAERSAVRWIRPVLAVSLAVSAVVVLLVPRGDDSLALEARAMTQAGAAVTARGDTAVEPMVSTNPGVVLYRVTARPSGAATCRECTEPRGN